MYKNQNLYSIILPTYNQKENLPIIIYLIHQYSLKEQHFIKSNYQIQVIVVDDNSTDGTGKMAEQLSKLFIFLKVLHRPKKLGLGSAYIDGIKICTGNFIIIMDADLSHHPKYILDFIKRQKQSNADIVSGTRYNHNGGVYGWPLKRKIVSRVANFIALTSLGVDYSDLTGSFRLYKKQALQKIINKVVCKGYAFQMQIIIRSHYQGLKIEQVGIVFVDRLYGHSKLDSKQVFIYLQGIFKLMFSY